MYVAFNVNSFMIATAYEIMHYMQASYDRSSLHLGQTY